MSEPLELRLCASRRELGRLSRSLQRGGYKNAYRQLRQLLLDQATVEALPLPIELVDGDVRIVVDLSVDDSTVLARVDRVVVATPRACMVEKSAPALKGEDRIRQFSASLSGTTVAALERIAAELDLPPRTLLRRIVEDWINARMERT